MDIQTLLNFAFSGLLALAGLVYKDLIKKLESHEDNIGRLEDRIHELDKVVAGDYVKRSEFDKNIEKLFKKLDDISLQLNKKVDR